MSGMSDDRIDLRSDTVTLPSPAMRRAMAEAELGDDVFGDDPTVNALQARVAELLGKEAALFVASGTMGNLVSVLAQVPRGGQVIAPAGSHHADWEAGGHAVVAGASLRALEPRADGTLDPLAVRDAWHDTSDAHFAATSLVVIENTNGRRGGQPISAAATAEVATLAHERGVPLHIDGARLFNAAVALETSAAELAREADTVTVCLSKGLACPVGSVVAGQKDVIHRAWRARKLLGGGMRQAGVIAAAGLVALEDGPEGMIQRLAEDHVNARRLAEALAAMPGVVDLDPATVRTNFVVFSVAASGGPAARLSRLEQRARVLETLATEGVLMVPYREGAIRAVTHFGIDAADIERTIGACARALEACGIAPSMV
jgi:threonine aldolase